MSTKAELEAQIKGWKEEHDRLMQKYQYERQEVRILRTQASLLSATIKALTDENDQLRTAVATWQKVATRAGTHAD